MYRLYNILQTIEAKEEFLEILKITFTEKELAMIEERWEIFELLNEGLTQRVIAEKLHCGIATVTRGAKAYRKDKALIQKCLSNIKIQ